jgi:hypothetical protein
LDLLGQDRDDAFPGSSLARYWGQGEGPALPAQEPLLMETDKPTLLANQGREPVAKGPMKSLVAAGMHYIRSGDGTEELFSLDRDPEERTNLGGFPEAQRSLEGFRWALQRMFGTRPSGAGRAVARRKPASPVSEPSVPLMLGDTERWEMRKD